MVNSLLMNLVNEFIMSIATSPRLLGEIMNSLNLLCNEIGTISFKT
jgi:hypothetical protein